MPHKNLRYFCPSAMETAVSNEGLATPLSKKALCFRVEETVFAYYHVRGLKDT